MSAPKAPHAPKAPQAPSTKVIWLAQNGQTSGPFTEEQIESMRASGELYKFGHIQAEGDSDWTAIQAPRAPAAPQAPKAPQAPEAPRTPEAPRAREAEAPTPIRSHVEKRPKADSDRWEVIAHDFRSVVSARITRINDEGCELASMDHHGSPSFPPDARLALNLLDPSSGRTVQAQAVLASYRRDSGGWVYKVRWTRLPDELFAA